MSRFNLIDEPWIRVVTRGGEEQEVSLADAFKNAGNYAELAGETETQNFAVLRVMLAVLQTVFSRYDADGNSVVDVDEKMRQTEEVEDEGDGANLDKTWNELWERGEFPEILYAYLNLWHDRFYLYDEKYPFYQITNEEMKRLLPDGKKLTVVTGRTMNRLISESQNKKSMFSPVSEREKDSSKDIMTDSQLARWLIAFQGYTGLSDKRKLYDDTQGKKPSRGWLFDLGGIYAKGTSLFETLMLNTVLTEDGDDHDRLCIQKPCWEFEIREVTDRLIYCFSIDNLSELYTNWSRAVYIDPALSLPGPVSVEIGKLPKFTSKIDIEPMTIWRFNENDNYTPRKHRPDEALWRSFGLIAENSEEKRYKKPGIIRQLGRKKDEIGARSITLQAVSMQDDSNATSWQPVDEIVDTMSINDMVVTDDDPHGWVQRITDVVEKTKKIIDSYFYFYLSNIAQIRNMKKSTREGFITDGKSNFYHDIDDRFRQWLAGINPGDSQDEKASEWYDILYDIARREADELVKDAGDRDYTGVVDKNGRLVRLKSGDILNIVNAYKLYLGTVKKALHRN